MHQYLEILCLNPLPRYKTHAEESETHDLNFQSSVPSSFRFTTEGCTMMQGSAVDNCELQNLRISISELAYKLN